METENVPSPVPQAAPQMTQGFVNTSGQKQNAVVPSEIKGWSWAAFLFSWIWGIGNETYIAFLVFIPLVGIIMAFVLGINGNEWAWRNKHWDSVEHFKRVQRQWVKWWLIIFGIMIVFFIAITVLAVIFGKPIQKTSDLGNNPPAANSATAIPAQSDGQSNNQTFPQEINPKATVVFGGQTYTIADKLSTAPGADYTPESYEWTKKGDTVDNWQSLITTHKLTPLDPAKPLSANDYAQNVSELQQKNGAAILETSVINTPDAKAQGVDITNPPYLLVYVYLNSDPTQPSEFDIQKIQGDSQGGVNSIIYGEKIQFKSDTDVKTYLASQDYLQNRQELILIKFPY